MNHSDWLKEVTYIVTSNQRELLFLNLFRTLAQCDQIGRFIRLWATFQSLWQQLICPNLLPSTFWCKGVKICNFSSEIIFGQLLKTFGKFLTGRTALSPPVFVLDNLHELPDFEMIVFGKILFLEGIFLFLYLREIRFDLKLNK